jgi:arginase family enzyme
MPAAPGGRAASPLMAQRKPAGSKEPALQAMELERIGIDGVVGRIRERIEDARFYLSIDTDVLDPAHAPGAGTPEVGDLTSRELLGILRGLAGIRPVGADVVEVAPHTTMPR